MQEALMSETQLLKLKSLEIRLAEARLAELQASIDQTIKSSRDVEISSAQIDNSAEKVSVGERFGRLVKVIFRSVRGAI